MPIHWRSQTDIDEENRYGRSHDPNRIVAIMTVNCLDCGEEIHEIHFADGRRSYDAFGVTNVVGVGVRHGRCLLDEDRRHDADLEPKDVDLEAEKVGEE